MRPDDAAGRSAAGDVLIDLATVLATSRIIVASVVRSLASVSDSVSVPQLRVLVMLSAAAPLNLTAVAQRLGVNASNASRTCDRLVKAGLIDRQVDPHDRRNVSLALTRKGRHLVSDVMDHRRKLLALVVGAMPAERQQDLAVALDAFNTTARRLVGDPADHAELPDSVWLM
ncbi:MAG: MarR family winged helix-turn-helix transcriptional regulator [Marmoricola sp.]